MGKDEKIILCVAFVLLVAVVIFQVKKPPAILASDPLANIPDVPTRRNYVGYNQSLMFLPPLGNILPQRAASLLGQPLPENQLSYSYGNDDCGCT